MCQHMSQPYLVCTDQDELVINEVAPVHTGGWCSVSGQGMTPTPYGAGQGVVLMPMSMPMPMPISMPMQCPYSQYPIQYSQHPYPQYTHSGMWPQ